MRRFLLNTDIAGDYIARRQGVYERIRGAGKMVFVHFSHPRLLRAVWSGAIFAA
jgi:hypothetical protein